MTLLSPADQQKLSEAFQEMTRPVRLVFFTQALGSDTCAQTRRILDELPRLSDKISIDEVNLVLELDKAAEYGVDRVPAIAVLYQETSDGPAAEPALRDSRIRFLGAPSGYEFVSLARAVLLAGGGESELTEDSRSRLAAVDKPMTMQVFTTPT
jgi:alkyl hydroperoxide reductase subunit AhpF